MIFHVVTIGELSAFGSSELFQKLDQLPITLPRLRSQLSNPRATPAQVVLIIAYTEGFELLGYIGALPDTLFYDNRNIPIAWNSCWWVHAQKGKAVTMRLFSMLMRAWEGDVCFADLPAKSKDFIEATHNFNLLKVEGYRLLMRVYMYPWLFRKSKYFRYFPLSAVLKAADALINSCLAMVQRLIVRPLPEVQVVVGNFFTDEALSFIAGHTIGNISHRNGGHFRWITNCPWIVNDTDPEVDRRDYFFSSTAKIFAQRYLEFRIKGRLAAVALLTLRDGHYRVSYFFGLEAEAPMVSRQLLVWLVRQNSLSLMVSHPCLIKPMRKYLPAWRKKTVTYAAFPRKFGAVPDGLLIQAGDGDAVFT